MTKEEILDKCDVQAGDFYYEVAKTNVLTAMDEWAKQEAIAFARFIADGNYTKAASGAWCPIPNWKDEYFSTEQLYTLFINSKQQ